MHSYSTLWVCGSITVPVRSIILNFLHFESRRTTRLVATPHQHWKLVQITCILVEGRPNLAFIHHLQQWLQVFCCSAFHRFSIPLSTLRPWYMSHFCHNCPNMTSNSSYISTALLPKWLRVSVSTCLFQIQILYSKWAKGISQPVSTGHLDRGQGKAWGHEGW